MNLTSLHSTLIADRGKLPNASAIYFITDPDRVPLYIGESEYLKIRWQAHSKRLPAVALGADRILWFKIKRSRRIAAERWLIGVHQPVLNTAGTPRDLRRRGPKPRQSP